MIWLLLIPVLPYFFILLEIYRNLRRVKPFIMKRLPPVKVSVVIACRDEERNLSYLLNDLYSQDYNPDLFEVIVIDDNSVDATFKIASENKQIRCLKVLHNPSEGKKSAIRAGVNIASGELIITTDADCRMGERWISTLSAFYCATEPGMIIAPVQLENKPGFAGRFRELEFLSLQGITAGTALEGNPVMCNGANLSFTKKTYLNHSGNLHDEILSGDDIFFLHSLKKDSSSKIAWLSSAEVIVTTSQTATLNSYVKQRARWISKAKFYTDSYTRLLSIITFVTIITNLLLLILGIINQEFLLVFLVSLILKAIPDMLILYDTTVRYNKRHLLKWFIPSQIIYPFYVLIVVGRAFIPGNSWK
jgi:cellulose synthase/poly-beta-1,6-N-acetylglucosamine synthase-like glycosyltransferase